MLVVLELQDHLVFSSNKSEISLHQSKNNFCILTLRYSEYEILVSVFYFTIALYRDIRDFRS